MKVKVKPELTKSLSPPQNILNKSGELIQIVGDGYNLIEFDNVFDKKGNLLQWYVHDQDFYIPQRIENNLNKQ